VADEIKVAPGAVLAKQGRPAEWFFLIETGEAEVARGADSLGRLGPGEYFGEVALLGRGPHPVTMRAVTTMTMFVIGAQRFLPLVDDIHRLRLDMDAALLRQAELVALTRGEHLRRLRPRRQAWGRRAPTNPPVALPPALRAVAIPPKAMPLDAGLPARRRARLTGLVLAIVTAIVTISTLYHPPFAVIAPGPAIDVSKDIAISGVDVHHPRGRYLMLTTLRAEFMQSRVDAAAAAARAAGMAVSPTGRPPFAVHFRDRDVVGPSAGLVYALAIEDMLSPTDRARGRVIAATGEIAPTGAVSGVGYVTEKTVSARRAGVQLLLVPQSDIDSTSESGVPVDGVASLEEALTDLTAGSPD
jgi:hypothetical protein